MFVRYYKNAAIVFVVKDVVAVKVKSTLDLLVYMKAFIIVIGSFIWKTCRKKSPNVNLCQFL